jgi:hypothetical protein
MKISRLKVLSTVCFVLTLVVATCYFYKEYKDAKNQVVFIQKSVTIEDFKTARIEEIKNKSDSNTNVTKTNVESTEEESNSTNEVEEVVEPEIVYDGLTMEELASKLDRTLASTLAGKGYLYASYCLERGVDPYLAVAISMEETGCAWGCSNLVVSCNNVGGMKGSGCGSYSAFSTIDDGIMAFIDNIANNYVAYGLTNAELMNPKYAENPLWASNVNAYIEKIRNR